MTTDELRIDGEKRKSKDELRANLYATRNRIEELKKSLLDRKSNKTVTKKKINDMYKSQRTTINQLMRSEMIPEEKIEDKTEVLTSKMKKNVNDDKTEVLTSDMKDEDYKKKIIDYDDEIIELPIENDDKTEVLTSGMKKNINDDKTDILTSDMKKDKKEEVVRESVTAEIERLEKKEKMKSARVVFDGTYKLYINNDSEVFEKEIDEDTLRHNCDINGIYDFNIVTMLKEFDEKNETNLYDRYRDNKLPVDYDYSKSEKNKTKKSILKRLKTITDKEKNDKEFKNVTVKNSQKKKFRAAAVAVGLAAVTLLGTFGYNLKKNTNANGIIKPIEHTKEAEDDAGVTDAYYEEAEVNVNDNSMINDSFEDIELVDTNDVVEETVEDTVEEKKEEVKETKVGDIVTFTDDVDLYYASTDLNPAGNTSYIGERTGKVGLISVVYDGNVVAYVDDNSKSLEEIKEECIAEYGDDIKVSVNLDSLDDNEEMVTQYLGWVDSNDFQNKVKVLR